MRHAASKIVSREKLREILVERKQTGARVVFANGCFDTLHVGHIRYLEGAREQGDVLVAAVNSDASVRELKGPGRPILPESARALVSGYMYGPENFDDVQTVCDCRYNVAIPRTY